MPKSNTQSKRDERARKRERGLVPKEIWCKPIHWPEIQAFCQNKARKELLSNNTKQAEKLK